MKLSNKIKEIKNTVQENFKEYNIIKNMTASEIAERYGYTNLYNYICNKMMNIILEREEKEANGEEVDYNSSILIKIKQYTKDTIVICEHGFGEKETYNYDIVVFMLKKYDLNSEITYIDGDEFINLTMLPEKLSLEDIAESISTVSNEYLEKAKEVTKESKQKTGDIIKKCLKNASDWADKNL